MATVTLLTSGSSLQHPKLVFNKFRPTKILEVKSGRILTRNFGLVNIWIYLFGLLKPKLHFIVKHRLPLLYTLIPTLSLGQHIVLYREGEGMVGLKRV